MAELGEAISYLGPTLFDCRAVDPPVTQSNSGGASNQQGATTSSAPQHMVLGDPG